MRTKIELKSAVVRGNLPSTRTDKKAVTTAGTIMLATFFHIINCSQYCQVQPGTGRFTVKFRQLSGCQYSVRIIAANCRGCILVILLEIPNQLWIIVVDIYAGEQNNKPLIVLRKDICHIYDFKQHRSFVAVLFDSKSQGIIFNQLNNF